METNSGLHIPGFRETERPLRILVIDQDRAVRVLLETVLSAEGMTVDTTDSHEKARTLIDSHPYDLFMIEEGSQSLHGMASEHGIEFLRDLRSKGIETPALVMTSFPTAKMLDASFEAGASDFIKKPFAGIAHLVSRACLVAEHGSADRFYERLLGDLSAWARSKDPNANIFKEALQHCQNQKSMLSLRPSAIIVDRDSRTADDVAATLEKLGHTIEKTQEPSKALARITDPRGPLVLIVDLGVSGALSTISRARATGSPPEIIVLGGSEHLFDALQGVDLGAGDYCLRDENTDALARRVNRAIDHAKRRFTKREVLSTIQRIAAQIQKQAEKRLEESDDTSDETLKGSNSKRAEQSYSTTKKREISTKRIKISLPAIFTPEDSPSVHGRILDISPKGMFVSTDQPCPRETRVRVYIDASSLGLPKPVEVACIVHWNVKYDPDPSNASGMGVSLVDNESSPLDEILEILRIR